MKAGKRGIGEPATKEGDPRLFFFLAAASDQSARVAAEQQAIAEVRSKQLRQLLDGRAVARGDERDRKIESGGA